MRKRLLLPTPRAYNVNRKVVNRWLFVSILVSTLVLSLVLIGLSSQTDFDADSPEEAAQPTKRKAPQESAQPKQTDPPAPYDESKILKLDPNIVSAPQTVVTAYFEIKSKHSSSSYDKWMKNMLSLQDPLVIFLSPSLIPKITELRSHALNRTVIIPMELNTVPLATQYNESFWQHQLDIDREKRIHKSYSVFWIWLSKSWWVTEAIRHNFFKSEIFVWSDIGCFRDGRYNHKKMVRHPEQIPNNTIVQMAFQPNPNPPKELFWNNKVDLQHFFHSGSQMAGHTDTWKEFHKLFLEVLQGFVERDMFIGDDQTVSQSTCSQHPDMCGYFNCSEVNDNNFFGLRTVLHHGGDYKIWRFPGREGVV